MNIFKTLLVGVSLTSSITVAAVSSAQDNSLVFSNSDPIPPIKSADGKREFNIRGRIMMDWGAGSDDNPDNNYSGTKLRAGWVGLEGKVADNLSFRFEVNTAGEKITVLDAFVRYNAPDWNLTVGNFRVPHSIDYMTPISMTTFMERSAFRFAFGFGRATGVMAATSGDNWGLTVGVYQGDYKFSTAANEGIMASGRASYGGKIGNGKWMLATSARHRNRKDDGFFTYKAKAITNQSMVMSQFASQALKDNLLTLESAVTQGPFFAAAEYAYLSAQDAIAPGMNTNLAGGYIEAGYILSGEQRPMNFKTGAWGRPQVDNPVGDGGKGFWMISARYDMLDLNDGTAFGGEQESYLASVTWYLTRYLRAILDYGHTVSKNRGSIGAKNSADVVGLRFNIDW